MISDKELCKLAKEAMERAYCPYSHFKVGACLLAADGSVYQGCNIENAAYSPTVCAERVAFFKAVSEGKREFIKIAIASSDGHPTPCGVCRQVMSEFCKADFEILLCGDDIEKYTLKELLPKGFSL